MNDIVTSSIRTTVPAIVGALLGWLTVRGITVDPVAVTGFTAFLTAVFTGLYYLVVRVLATRFPKLELLLGSAKQPTYKDAQ